MNISVKDAEKNGDTVMLPLVVKSRGASTALKLYVAIKRSCGDGSRRYCVLKTDRVARAQRIRWAGRI